MWITAILQPAITLFQKRIDTCNSDKNVENELKKHKLSRIIAAYLILFANFPWIFTYQFVS